jgi:copper(I)-binding protein
MLFLSACSAPKGVTVREAWIRATKAGENGAIYFVLMQMTQVSSVALDTGSEVTFEPGGLHVMLVGLKKELKVGDVIELTLHLKKHADILVRVPVAEFAPDEHSH